MFFSKNKVLSNKIIPSIIQIMLLMIIIPLFIAILKFFNTPNELFYNWFIESLGTIEPISLGISLAEGWIKNGISGEKMVELSIFVLFNSFFHAIIMGLMCHIFKKLFEIAKVKGLPILATFFGVFSGATIIHIVDQNSSGMTELVSMIAIIVIISIGIKLMIKSFSSYKGKFFEFKNFASLILDSLCAVMACLYISTLAMCISLKDVSPAKAIGVCFTISGLFLLFITIIYLISCALEIDK